MAGGKVPGMANEKRIYWSHIAAYTTCPRNFLWSSGWPGIDLGQGPGKRMKRPEKVDRTHAIMGQAIQEVVELMYNYDMWNKTDDRSRLETALVHMTEKTLARLCSRDRQPSTQEMQETCKKGVLNYLDIASHHSLWGVPAKPEYELLSTVDGVPMGGRVDLLYTSSPFGTMILDGKNSKSKSYVSQDQLRWYSLIYESLHGQLPDRVGFVWYRHPPQEDSEDTGITWVDLRAQDMTKLRNKMGRVVEGMRLHQFDPSPSEKACRFCDFQSICPDKHPMVGEMPEGPTTF